MPNTMTFKLYTSLNLDSMEESMTEQSKAFGPSMLPTLAGQGEWIIVDKWSHRKSSRTLQKGDIATVMRPDILGRRQTKRITAVEGDTVTYTMPYTDSKEKTVLVPSCSIITKERSHRELTDTKRSYLGGRR